MKSSLTERIGQHGERLVAATLKDLPNATLYTNLYIPHQGHHTEVDLLLLSKTGIYVIEAKHYSGKIRGSCKRLEWSRAVKGVKKPIKFYSPLRQNETHRQALVRYLGIPESKIHSMIVFSGSCTLYKVPANTARFTILKLERLRNALMRRLRASKTAFTDEEVQIFKQKLKRLKNPSERQKKQHVAWVKKAEKKRKAAQEKRRKSRKS